MDAIMNTDGKWEDKMTQKKLPSLNPKKRKQWLFAFKILEQTSTEC